MAYRAGEGADHPLVVENANWRRFRQLRGENF
jgi:hypothetical protein